MKTLKKLFGQEELELSIPLSRLEKDREDEVKQSRNRDFHQAKTHGSPTILLATFLYVILHLVQRVLSFWYLKRSGTNVFFIWLQSVIVVASLRMRKSRRRQSFFQEVRRLNALPALGFYVLVFVSIDGTQSNRFVNTSGGCEVQQLGLAISPLSTILVTSWFHKNTNPVRLMGIVVTGYMLMMMLFCAENDPYIPYKFSFMHGILGIVHGTSLALFALSAKTHLQEMTISNLVYSINLCCVVCLPVIFIVTGELNIVLSDILPGRVEVVVPLTGVVLMAVLRFLNQAASLYLIQTTSPLLYITTRCFTWIPITLAITFTFKMELLVSSFQAFWIAVAVFLAVLFDELL